MLKGLSKICSLKRKNRVKSCYKIRMWVVHVGVSLSSWGSRLQCLRFSSWMVLWGFPTRSRGWAQRGYQYKIICNFKLLQCLYISNTFAAAKKNKKVIPANYSQQCTPLQLYRVWEERQRMRLSGGRLRLWSEKDVFLVLALFLTRMCDFRLSTHFSGP